MASGKRPNEEMIIPISIDAGAVAPEKLNLYKTLTTLSINENSEVESIQTSAPVPVEVSENPPPENIVELLKEICPRKLTTHNVPEKIVICIDACLDPEFTAFKVDESTKYSPFFMLKRIVELFVLHKNMINEYHEFSLIVLEKERAKWVCDFTSNPANIISALNNITECEQSDSFSLDSIFEEIIKNILIPVTKEDLGISPPYTIRTILLYDRSYCLPSFENKSAFVNLLNSPYFTLDVLMTHENSPPDNNCSEIFQVLKSIDGKDYSYNFQIPRNAVALHECMAKLLAHPFQRQLQSEASYAVNLPIKAD